MRAVTGVVTSSNPISLSKAAAVLSRFATSDTGARPDVAAYLRRASAAFNELVAVHREIRTHGKISHVDVKEGATQDEDNSHLKKKKKKKKGNYYEGDAGTSILEPKGEMGGTSKKKTEALRSEKSEERRYWKENMRKEDRLQEVDGVGLLSESQNTEKKKRKHLYAGQGEVNGEMEQHEGKKKSKRRTVEWLHRGCLAIR